MEVAKTGWQVVELRGHIDYLLLDGVLDFSGRLLGTL